MPRFETILLRTVEIRIRHTARNEEDAGEKAEALAEHIELEPVLEKGHKADIEVLDTGEWQVAGHERI